MEALDNIFNSNDILETREVAELTPGTLYDICVSRQDYFVLLEVKNCSDLVFYYDAQDAERDEVLLERAVKIVNFFFGLYSNSFDVLKMKEDEISGNLLADIPTAFPWLILLNHTGFKEALKTNRVLRNSTFGNFTFQNVHKNYVVARLSNKIRPARLIKMLCELNDYLSDNNIVNGNSIVVINTSAIEVKKSSLFNDPDLNPKFKNSSITNSNKSLFKGYSKDSASLYFFSLFDSEKVDVEKEREYFERFSRKIDDSERELYSDFKAHLSQSIDEYHPGLL